jgi:hypothetical protein
VAVVLAAGVLGALAVELRGVELLIAHSPAPLVLFLAARAFADAGAHDDAAGLMRADAANAVADLVGVRQVLDFRVDGDHERGDELSAPGLRSDGLSVPGIVS